MSKLKNSQNRDKVHFLIIKIPIILEFSARKNPLKMTTLKNLQIIILIKNLLKLMHLILKIAINLKIIFIIIFSEDQKKFSLFYISKNSKILISFQIILCKKFFLNLKINNKLAKMRKNKLTVKKVLNLISIRNINLVCQNSNLGMWIKNIKINWKIKQIFQ